VVNILNQLRITCPQLLQRCRRAN